MKCCLLMAALAVACVAQADKVLLKSGSSLTGTVVGTSSDVVTFKSDDLGEVKIPVKNIVKLDNAGSHVIQYKDRSQETKPLAVKDGRYVSNAKPLAMGDIKAIDPEVEKWHGSINAGYNSSRGNTIENSWNVLANINRRWENDRFKGNLGYYYSEKGTATEDPRKSTDRWEGEAQHDHFWWPKIYHYENFHFDRDTVQLLKARYRLGLGGGYQWLDNSVFESTGKWSFNQEFGVNWVREDYEKNDDESADGFAALRYAHHLNYIPKWTPGVEAFHNCEYLPDVHDWDKYLVKGDIGFSTKIIYDFDLLVKFEWDYNSQPANERKKSDYRTILGLGYKW